MSRFRSATALLALLLFLPAAAWAQKEPPHTKETKNAEKFIGLAMTRPDAASRRPFLEQALPPLREAMAKNPDNGRVWLMAASVYAGLGQYAAADSAFDKAVELYPPYAEQVNQERHSAWEAAFNDAVRLINDQKMAEGVAALEAAELLFDHRPEAKYYLGLFYLQDGRNDDAERVFKGAIEAVNGPVRAQLPPEAAAEWDKIAANARVRLSNVEAMRAADLYDAGKYEEAAAGFAKAREMNKASRDHLFNQLQSVYALALDLDKQREGTKSSTLDEKAKSVYSTVIALTDTLRTVDPRNEDIFFFSSRAHKVLSEIAKDQAGKKQHMDGLRAVNAEYEQLNFLIGDIQIAEEDTSATVNGTLLKKKMQGGDVTVTFELLGMDGNPIGSAPIVVTVPASAAADTKIPFTASIPAKEAIAGWRYRID